ncbi:GNAT family N-acetyltransferase [Ovoidimarina sediminis]|uniref:GNAT family N-acetyltransferase n=1 Tax=Ovoidimarina sediminis TaxID=3079856 RepID=UPI002911D348|nr:GNAT family N-acetyltransferase [Rhodophyticola sp. MJ-SS7]MDU8943854.1 GNAT family N-acetyltransferase [Rhodophyticola sp. MJ-SS7]
MTADTPNPAIEIRPAPRAVKDRMAALCEQTFEEHRARQPHAFPKNAYRILVAPLVEAAFFGTLRSLKQSPNAYAAFIGGEFASYVLLSHWARRSRKQMPYVSVDDICVEPAFRGRGVARALLRHVRALAEERGWDSLTAQVWTGNDASEALFRSEGFTPDYIRFSAGPGRQARDYPNMTGPSLVLHWLTGGWFTLVSGAIAGAALMKLFG